MFVIKPSTILTFGAVISLQLVFIITIMMVNDNQQVVEANLMGGIYHKYRPRLTIDHLLNSSASSLISQIDSQHQHQIRQNPESRSMVSSGSNSNNNNHEDRHPHPPPPPPPPPPAQVQQMHYAMPHQHLQSASNQLGPSYQSGPPTLMGSDRQQWTVMETGGPMGFQSLVSDSQPAQMIAASMPFEQQYQLQHMIDDNGNQIALQVPSGFSQSSNGQQQHFQQLASFPTDNSQQSSLFLHNQQQDQSQMQQQQQQQQQLQTQEAQPIFLSSYVPEMIQAPSRGVAPNANSLQSGAQDSGSPEQGQSPDSIQDNIQAKEAAAAAEPLSGKSEAQEANDDGDDSEPSGRAPPGRVSGDESDENDIEEPQRNNEHQGEEDGSGEPSNNDESGSISYEDKYDSDKDEPRSSSQAYAAASPTPPPPSSSSSGVGDLKRVEASGNSIASTPIMWTGLNDDCLQCICRAASGCDHQLRCVTRGSDDKYCGPFQLTEEYWNMAGSPGDASTNFSSFEDCANDADCAVETVTNYMRKYYRDCDGDGWYTCMDFARLHKLKPDECGSADKLINNFDAYWAKFEHCAEGFNRSRTGDDENV